jgi:serine protease AprX
MRLPNSRAPGSHLLPLVLALLAAPASARPAPPADPLLSRLDPALALLTRVAPEASVSVWVTFRDKGERGPADLAARLAAAEAALTPRARARRLRAGVWPLVDERDLPVAPEYLAALERLGHRPIAVSRWLDQAAVRVQAGRLAEIAGLPFVSHLRPVEIVRRAADPLLGATRAASPTAARASAVDYGYMTAPLTQIGVPAVHDQGFTGSGVLIAVLDDGFNWFTKHEAFFGLVVPPERQRDFVRGIQDVQDTTVASGMNHGTQVLGCLAGRKLGTYVGAAFGADYALARTEVDATETPQEMLYWQMGAEWADSLGADVISSSLAYTTFDGGVGSYVYADMDGHTTIVSQAAEIAASKGILVVNAVGNYGAAAWHYLAAPSDVNGDSLIAVGAVDASGVPASFSSYGPSADGRIKPDLAARGVDLVLVAGDGQPNAYVGGGGGTSFSTPQVAGLAACLLQAHPSWTPREVIRALRATASQAAHPDEREGYGVPDGGAALAWNPAGAGAGAAVPQLQLRSPNPARLSAGPVRFFIGLTAGASDCAGRSASLEVFDSSGRRVGRPWSGVLPCGLGLSVSWDGLDRKGHRRDAGLYVAQLRSGPDRASLRLIVLP